MKIKNIAIAAVSSVMFACTTVPAGNVGVLVNLLGSEKGVQNEVKGVGRYWLTPNEELYIYPTYQMNYSYTRSESEGSEGNEEFVFQTKEGMQCSVDLGVSLAFNADKVATMFQTYRKGPEEIKSIVVRNSIRDALNRVTSKMPVEYVYGEGKTILLDSVKLMVKQELQPSGIDINNVYLIGSIRIPESVTKSLNAKVEASQISMRVENEVKTAEAQAKIRIAEAQGQAEAMLINARAEAESNRLKQQSLNTLLIQQQWIEKWDGKVPQVSTNGNGMIIDMKK